MNICGDASDTDLSLIDEDEGFQVCAIGSIDEENVENEEDVVEPRAKRLRKVTEIIQEESDSYGGMGGGGEGSQFFLKRSGGILGYQFLSGCGTEHGVWGLRVRWMWRGG